MLTSSFAYCPEKILAEYWKKYGGKLEAKKIDTNSNSL